MRNNHDLHSSCDDCTEDECTCGTHHHPAHKAVRIGITGTIGSGKSSVAEIMRSLKIPVIDADLMAKELYGRRNVQSWIRTTFGEKVFDHGSVSFQELGRKVFSNGRLLKKLNSFLHPLLITAIEKEFKSIERSGESIAVLDAALLFETDMAQSVDVAIVVEAPAAVRRHRAANRMGVSLAEIRRRERTQLSTIEKRKLADIILINNGSKAQLKSTVKQLLKILTS